MNDVRTEMVAIVGMAGRFPQAPDLEAFWELLIAGGDAVRPVPADRWGPEEVYDPAFEIQAVGGFLEGVDRFDAGFFAISPREAEVMDPQQRLMLETVWRALEDAGEPTAGLRGTRTGVYVGGLWHDYELLRRDNGAGATQHSIVGNSLDILSSRVSYFLGLTGPSLTIESSCSSSLVALHQACQALRHGEVEAALVGGSNLVLTPEVTIGLTHFGGLSPTGRCHAFGAGADGFVRGEGVAAVYLKTLDRALRDGDRVRAVVVTSAVNNDGGGDSLVTPNPAAQRDLLEHVYGSGVVPLEKLAYVEAHGTGTVRGDVAEAGALGDVLGKTCTGRRLHIGSVKTNIGHLEPAAGLAGLIKAVLSLEHGTVPPSLHAEDLNPQIDFDRLNLTVTREPLTLAPDSYLGVNSFGWGGTNAHAVVTAPPSAATSPATAPADPALDTPFLLTLSAHDTTALDRLTSDVRERLNAGASARDMAQALAWRRDHFAERRVLLGPGLTETAAGRARGTGRTAFVFPGQGAQWAGMGAGLYGAEPEFTRTMDRCAEALSRHVPWDVRELVLDGADHSRVDQVQPALWAMSVSLAAAWAAVGVRPDVVVGHSQGEIAAATVAGALSLADGALVVSRRSEILRKVAGHGRMLAVDLDPAGARRALRGFEGLVELAVHNGPRSCVLAGDTDAVLLLKEILEADDVFCRLVDVDYGSHSPQMEGIVPLIEEALAPTAPQAGHTPLLSTVDLRRLDGSEMNAGYWAANLRSQVRFAEAIGACLDNGVTHLVEVSPHPGLGAALRQLAADQDDPPAVLGTLRRGEGRHVDLLRAFGDAYVSGLDVRGARPERRPSVSPPPYPFRRERYWPEPGRGNLLKSGRPAITLAPSTARGVWEGSTELSVEAHPWLADHRLYDAAVFPAGAYLALAQGALAQGALAQGAPGDRAEGAVVFQNVDLFARLALDDGPVELAATWRPGAGSAGILAWESTDGNGWRRHCEALVSRSEPAGLPVFPAHLLNGEVLDADTFYWHCTQRNLDYGPAFRSVTGGFTGENEALVSLELPAAAPSVPPDGILHPVLWDGILQSALAVGDGPPVPVSIRTATVAATGSRELWAHARRSGEGFDITVYAADQTQVGRLEGVVLADLPPGGASDDISRNTYRMVFRTGDRTGDRRMDSPGRTVVCGQTDLLPDLPGAEELAGADTVAFVAPANGREGLTELSTVVRRCLDENPSAGLAVVVRDGSPEAGMYAGFVAVVQAEHPQLATRLIETDVFTSELTDELSTTGDGQGTQDRVVLRAGERLVGERVRGGTSDVPAPWRSSAARHPFRQAIGRPGRLDTLCRLPVELPAVTSGTVEIAVEAASLNFIDVMKAMGVYPDTSGEHDLLGLDCAGTVTTVGPGVAGITVGDRVVACVFGALASRVRVDSRHVVPVPDGMSVPEAAALPMVLVTAWYSLAKVAGIEPDETILIHSAAGGLGLAAVQLARAVGAKVIATAGTEEKRRYLRELGVEHVFDSRGLDWAEDVRFATSGRGVDVVLNSLTGAAIPLGMRALAEDGRFVEVGKRDIYDGTSVDLGPFRKSITFSAVDIAGLLRRRPNRFASVFREAWELVETGKFRPLPVQELAFADAEEAFRSMVGGEHIGKVVLTDPASCTTVVPQPMPQGRFRAGGTYLISGGLGALGMSLAEFLARSGAGAIALLGRSGPKDPERIEALRAHGTRVGVWSADIADQERVRTVLDEIRSSWPPLRGVFHAAGTLGDATLLNLDAGLVKHVMRPKADGARVLHELTADDPLDLFVLFSSAAAFVGTAGQAAYAAANGCLDALALARRRTGLPGLSVQWGPFSGIGLAAERADRGGRLADRGMGGVTAEEAWDALRRFIEADEAVVTYAALDARRWMETYPATGALTSWQSLAGADSSRPDTGLRGVPDELRRQLVEETVLRDAGSVLRIAPDILARDVPLRSLGLDSLMSLELRNRLEASLELRLSPTLLWKYGTVSRLGAALTDMLAADEEQTHE